MDGRYEEWENYLQTAHDVRGNVRVHKQINQKKTKLTGIIDRRARNKSPLKKAKNTQKYAKIENYEEKLSQSLYQPKFYIYALP